MVWLFTSICSSSAFKSGSPKISHHLPRATVSRGWPIFHPVISLYESGVGSLKLGTAAEVGRTYFGPTMQEADNSASVPAANHLAEPLIANTPDKSTVEYIPDN